MDDITRRALIEAIHATPTMLVLAVAGGGNAVITDLLEVPGASRTVLEVRVPYAQASLVDLVGPGADLDEQGAVSPDTAEAMARACLDRARALAGGDSAVGAEPGLPLLGVGVTAALVSDRPKRGEHRAHVAVAGPAGVDHRFVALVKGERDRSGEDRVVADEVVAAVAEACGISSGAAA